MAKSVAFSQSSFLLTSLSHLKNVIDYSLVGPSLNSAPVPSVTFHSLLCLLLLPIFFFFFSPLLDDIPNFRCHFLQNLSASTKRNMT